MTELKKLLIGMAETFGITLSVQRLQIYVDLLSDLPLEVVKSAVHEILRDPSQKFFPLPAVIRERVNPGENPDHEAVEASNRIVEAISRFGFYNPTDAKAFIGELGWLVVQREGGWETLCETVMAPQLPILKAQWRELAKALYGRAKRGAIDSPPELPSPSGGVVRSLAERLSIARGKQ